MTSQQIRTEVAKTLKSLNVKRTDVSSRVEFAGYSIAVIVRAKNENVDMAVIKRALSYLEVVDRCERTGEILDGGNTLLCVKDIKGYLV